MHLISWKFIRCFTVRALVPQNYTNRNRRKRLRRKRAQPSRYTTDCIGSPFPATTAVDGVSLGLQGAPPASALANVSLKPQWAREKHVTGVGAKKIDSVSDSGKTLCLLTIFLVIQILCYSRNNSYFFR